jgi:DNA-binding transcriptional ArsR family regulator
MSRSSAAESVFTAIANPTRRRVLHLIRHREYTVTELQRATRSGQSALSQHLAVLRRARLVQQRRDGQQRYYSLRSPSPLRDVVDWVAYFDELWNDRLARLGTYLDKQS